MPEPINHLPQVAALVAAYLSRNKASPAEIAAIIRTVHSSLASLGAAPAEAPPLSHPPAVPIRKSITPDYIVCLEDGKKLKLLKRHLRTSYSLTPDEYRAKWKLPPDYPMVAPNYAAKRSVVAKEAGLGVRGPKQRQGRPGR